MHFRAGEHDRNAAVRDILWDILSVFFYAAVSYTREFAFDLALFLVTRISPAVSSTLLTTRERKKVFFFSNLCYVALFLHFI